MKPFGTTRVVPCLETHGPTFGTEESRAAADSDNPIQVRDSRSRRIKMKPMPTPPEIPHWLAALKHGTEKQRRAYEREMKDIVTHHERERATYRKLRDAARPVKVLSLAKDGGWWRCDLDGYFVVDVQSYDNLMGVRHKKWWYYTKERPRTRDPIGISQFRKISMEPADGYKLEVGQRPYGRWVRLPTKEHSVLPETVYEHSIYGRCTMISKDGVHAIVQTHDELHIGPKGEDGRPTLVTVPGRRVEVHILNLTLVPLEQIPAPRYRKCRATDKDGNECGHEFLTTVDCCPKCGTEFKPTKAKALPRKLEVKIDRAKFEAAMSDQMDDFLTD